jgi:translocation protein SEC63
LPEKDDDQLEKLQSDVAMRRQRLLEGKSQFSHSVYCPFYPEDKQEYWWAYITDRKQQMLLTAPYHITNLVEHEEIQLKFTAPFKPGFYTFAVCLRSDSYFGFDQMKDIKVYSG